MVVLQNLLLLFISLLLGACPVPSRNIQDSVSGRVIAVKDGDTIDILYHGRKLTIRFAHIDCPEKGQPFGQVAKKFVSDHCFNQVVTVLHQNDYDRSKRLIGEVILTDGSNLNQELVKAGLAWHFKKYSLDRQYALLENEARKKRAGLWSQNNALPPWEWRKK